MQIVAGNIEDVTRVIQLAVAPVFLLAAVATSLMVLTNRLARAVDRGRHLERSSLSESSPHRRELSVIVRRAHLIYRALTLGVLAAILVCVLMTAAFLGEVLGFNAARVVAVLFIGALFAYTCCLLCLLREVFLAVGSFQLGVHPAPPSS